MFNLTTPLITSANPDRSTLPHHAEIYGLASKVVQHPGEPLNRCQPLDCETDPHGKSCSLFWIATTRAFRDLIAAVYPQLDGHTASRFNWRMMEYLVFSTYEDRLMQDILPDGERRLVLPHERVAEMLGIHPKTLGFPQ